MNLIAERILAEIDRHAGGVTLRELTGELAQPMEFISGHLSGLKRGGHVKQADDLRWVRTAGDRAQSAAKPTNGAGLTIAGLTEHKLCVECAQTLHIDAFRIVRGGGRTKICNNCHNAKIKAGIAAGQDRGSLTKGPARRAAEEQREAQVESETPEPAHVSSARANYPPHVLAVLDDLMERQSMYDDAISLLQQIYGDYPDSGGSA